MEKTLKIAAVGTSLITETFAEAAAEVSGAELYAVYSRSADKGAAFAAKNGIKKSFYDFSELLKQTDIDVIYIASPNALHVPQAIAAMESGYDVILEKPSAVTAEEVRKMAQTARENGVFFLEAITTLFMPNYLFLKNELEKIGEIRRAQISFGRRSSKYDAYLRGEELNIFNPELQGGALNDMGIYCIHAAADLFGLPEKALYEAEAGRHGIDLAGTLTLEYPGFCCEIKTAKNNDIPCGLRVEGSRGYIVSEGDLNSVPAAYSCIDGVTRRPGAAQAKNRMVHELERFCDAFLDNDEEFFERMAMQSERAAGILEAAHLSRKQKAAQKAVVLH